MLSLLVVTQLGRAPAAPISASFGAAGGTIGRSPDCTLVLPDPHRHISREQARIDLVDGDYVVTCLGSANAIIVGNAELGPGQRMRLEHGDRIVIAEYEIRVDLAPEATVVRPGASVAAAAAARPASSASLIPDDFDPFAAPDEPPPRVAPAPASHPMGGRARSDEPAPPAPDPVADPLGLGVASPRAASAVPRPSDSIDALFGLDSAVPDPLGIGGPLASPLSMPNTAASADPLMALNLPPQAAPAPAPDRGSELSSAMRLPEAIPPTDFGLGPRILRDPAPEAPAAVPVPGPARDTGGPFLSWRDGDTTPPPSDPVLTQPVLASPAAVSASGAPGSDAASRAPDRASGASEVAGALLSSEEVRSIAERAAEAHRGDFEAAPATRPTDILDALNRAQLQALRETPAAPASAATATTPARELHACESVPAPVGAAPPDDAAFELLKGLLLGLGMTELPKGPVSQVQVPRTLTPELMRRIGELLRVATDGTIDLLQARAVLKREMKTEVTIIASADNNPLKFSPDGQAALAHLLSAKHVRGFMEPVPALRDAYDDLLAHQVGFVAGMRAAMQGLIERFDPAQLESRLTRKSVLDTMLPMGRKARLWELFNEMFAEISREAEDHFEQLFGREFVRAYEEQVARLRKGPH